MRTITVTAFWVLCLGMTLMTKPVTMTVDPSPVKIAVLVATWPTADPLPVGYDPIYWARVEVPQSDAFYAEQSYGQFEPNSDIFGVYTIPLDVTATRQDIARESKIAAVAAGVDLSLYQHFVYISPMTNSVAGGYGDLSGVWIAIESYPRAPQARMLSHELGHHFFGLTHAHALLCSDGTALGETRGANCQLAEYGDTLDVMGIGYGHFNASTKKQIGWLTTTGAYRIQTVTVSGDYAIAPYERVGGVKALTFRDKQGFSYTLEYRQRIGFDMAQTWTLPENVFHGVVAHLDRNGLNLLRLSPGTGTNIDTPALTVGATWCHRDGAFSVTTLSADENGAMVRIKLKGSCH